MKASSRPPFGYSAGVGAALVPNPDEIPLVAPVQCDWHCALIFGLYTRGRQSCQEIARLLNIQSQCNMEVQEDDTLRSLRQ